MNSINLSPTRLEAFSDGVIAIIITIMVLELKVPHAATPATLLAQWPTFMSYALSYVLVAIYWINHHHLFHFVKHVNHGILWANNLLLFCISLIPFFTAYMGENRINDFSVAMYAGIMFVCGLAFMILRKSIACHFKDNKSFENYHRTSTRKNSLALVLYALAIPAAYYHPAISMGLMFIVSVMYVVPMAFIKIDELKD